MAFIELKKRFSYIEVSNEYIPELYGFQSIRFAPFLNQIRTYQWYDKEQFHHPTEEMVKKQMVKRLW